MRRADVGSVDKDAPVAATNGQSVPKISQQDLESRLWGAANALRGPVDPGDFKTYVFPVLFWKWISDTWVYEHDEALDAYGDELTDEIEADFHRFVVPEGCLWNEVTKTTHAGLGSRVGKALGKIESANVDILANIFGDATWSNEERLPASALVALTNEFNRIPLDPESVSHDALGHAYEYLLKEFAEASGKKAGEFFTPPVVVHLLVGILAPQPGESVYDPACGSGGMLVETINAVTAAGQDGREVRLYGQEVNLTTSAIARMNLAFHRVAASDIKRGDTLRQPQFRDDTTGIRQFDVVLANPPFSLQNWGADTWAADPRSFCGVPPAKNGDYAWIQHMLASMRPETGRVGVVMPHGVLFRGGAEAKIRECLVRDDRLEAVVGLPTNLFYSTSIPACLLIFKGTKTPVREGHVLFVDGSARFVKGKNQNVMSEDDMNAVLEAYRTGEDPDGDGGVNVRLVPVAQIEANNWDLNIGRYVRADAVEGDSLETALKTYVDARAARIEAEARMFERLAAAGIEVPGV